MVSLRLIMVSRSRVFFHLANAHFVSCVGLSLDQLGWGSGGDKAVVGDGSVGEGGGGSVGNGSVCDGSVSEGWGSGVAGVGDGGSVGVGWGSGVADGGGGHRGDVLDSLLDGNWVRDGVGLLLNDWSLNDVLDLVDWVWLWDLNSDWDLDLVWLGHVPVHNDLSLDGGWHWHGHIDLVLVDLQFWLDPGLLWGDDGVGPGWGQHLLVGHGVSWGWSKVDRCWWNSGVWSGGNWSSWDGQLLGHCLVGGWCVLDGVSGCLVD